MRVAWYRTRAVLRRRLGGYLALAVLLGLAGGIAMAAVTAARRTDSSYPGFLAGTSPSGLVVQPFTNPSYSPGFVAQLGRLPHVRRAAAAVTFKAATLTPGSGIGTILLGQAQLIASTDGMYSRQDQVRIVQGRQADPRRLGEVVASPDAAALLHLRVGSRVPVGLVSGKGQVSVGTRLDLKVVGIGVFNLQVLQDDIDTGRTGFLLGTPALARRYASCCNDGMIVGLELAGGSRFGAAVGREYQHLVATSRYIPPGKSELQVYLTSAIEAEAQRAIRPEAIALCVFGLIAGAVALLIGTQSVSRQLRAGEGDAAVLRSLGAGPAVTIADGLLGLLGAVAAGALLAAAVAVTLSPFSLFGPVRQVEPGRGIYVDWTVLGLGTAALAVILGGLTVAVASRQAPHRIATRQAAHRGSGLVRSALAAGLPAPAVAGVRFALEPGHGHTVVPVRSVIAGAVLAAAVGTATLTFGAGLSALIAHPGLYGWNFGYALYAVQGWGTVPSRLAGPLLARDPNVAATTGVYFTTMQIGSQTVPAMLEAVRPAVGPQILSGHGLDGPAQMVLGPATLALLHERIGGVVTVVGGDLHARLRIVGTATLPTIGTVLSVHPSMSTGALISTAIVGGNGSGPFGGVLAGPNALLIRLRPGVSPAAGLRSVRAVWTGLNRAMHAPQLVARSGGGALADTISLLPAQRPAEIVNYKTMGAMPAILAGGLAAGAVAALAVTLITSVRRRRRDLALLKTLGFTRRQLAGAIGCQASVIAAAGLIIGVPLGIAAGRWLWLAFARQLSAVPEPVIPAASIALAAVAALALANLVAALPGRAAARTPPALVLRAE